MENLLHQRCSNHMLREAVARCPECRRYFCRECVTEHDDKVLCADCLENKMIPKTAGLARFNTLFRIFHFLLGTILLWIFFYYLGQILLSLPTAFHEGTLWELGWWKTQ
ncbi:MAG: rhomboid family protein [Deltaproteobacteria bacterium]|jgi:hypothetical protein